MKLDELLQKCRVQAQVKGYSQAYLSQELGVSRSALGHWMTGKRLPSLENLFALVNVLELELTLQPPPNKGISQQKPHKSLTSEQKRFHIRKKNKPQHIREQWGSELALGFPQQTQNLRLLIYSA